jgi:hypothetical protein
MKIESASLDKNRSMAVERKSPLVPRRHPRHRMSGPVTISWTAADGDVSCTGNCIDVSVYGLLVEVPDSIPIGTTVMIQLHGSDAPLEATVRQQRKYCGWHRIGVKFTTALRNLSANWKQLSGRGL